MGLLWSLFIVDPLIIASTVLCASATFFASPKTQTAVARFWGRSLLFFSRLQVKVEGLEHICPNTGYVFASNHLSYMDTPAVLSSIPVDFRFLAKKGLFEIPFLGTHLTRAGHIPVPREDPREAVRTLTKAADTVRSLGISLLIFPEGGRSETGEMQDFKDGAAYIAIKAQAPLVPLALIGTRDALPMGGIKFTPGKARLIIGEPIPTTGLTTRDRARLTATARERIVEMVNSGSQ